MSDDSESSSQWWDSGEQYHLAAHEAPDGTPGGGDLAPGAHPSFGKTWTPPEPGPLMAAPPAWVTSGDRRFYSVEMLIVLPICLLVLGPFAGLAVASSGGRPFGLILSAFLLAVTVWSLRMPYVAVAEPSGTLTFKALTNSTTTSVSQIGRIYVRTGGRGGSTWYFDFGSGSARLGGFNGRALARYVLERSPGIPHPRSLDRRRFFRLTKP